MIKISRTRRQTSARCEAVRVMRPLPSKQGLCEGLAAASGEPGSAGMWDWGEGDIDVIPTCMLSQHKGPEVESNKRKEHPLCENSSVLLPDYYSILSNCILKCSVGKKMPSLLIN